MWGGLAVGKIVVPALARSQVYGGVIQGIGYALYEERHVDPHTGTVLSLGLEEFRIPGIGDMPEVEVFFHEEGFEEMKGGGAGLSEVCHDPRRRRRRQRRLPRHRSPLPGNPAAARPHLGRSSPMNLTIATTAGDVTGDAEILAGGTDLSERLRSGIDRSTGDRHLATAGPRRDQRHR